MNTRLKTPVSALNFRPNFIVKTDEAFDEDNWEWIKIGPVIFRNIKNCTRCVMTTIDPVKGEKHPNSEPLKTLRT